MISEKIRRWRLEKGISQQELAKIVGKSQQAVNLWEKGENEPGIDTINILAEYFNVTTDYLFGREPKQHMALKEAHFPYLVDDIPNLDLDTYLIEIRKAVNKAVAAGDIEPERAEDLVKETTRHLLAQIEQLKKYK